MVEAYDVTEYVSLAVKIALLVDALLVASMVELVDTNYVDV